MHGSEGGEAEAFPTPIQQRHPRKPPKALFRYAHQRFWRLVMPALGGKKFGCKSIMMYWLDKSLFENDFFLGVAASLIGAVLYSILIKVYTYGLYLFKEKGVNAEISGYWVVSFSNKYSPEKRALEIFKFKRLANLKGSGSKYRFKYQHFNDVRYVAKPLLGGGVALSKGEQVSGVYGFDEEPMVLGSFLIKADISTKGRHSPRFMGSYYEFDDQRISQTHKNKYILYKINLLLWSRVKFIFGRPCMKGYDEAYAFYQSQECLKIFSNDARESASVHDE